MKRKLVLALTLIAMLAALMSGCGSADKEENSTDKQTETSDNTSDKEEIANPWTESDQQGVEKATGFVMTAPEGATEVSYSYMEDGALAQMTYVLDDAKWTYRIQQADELTDISGLSMKWTDEKEGTVANRTAVYYAFSDSADAAADDVQLVNWYDLVTGVVYSLSASGKDLNGMDMQAYAEKLYAPLQEEAEGEDEDNSENELDYFVGEHKRSSDESTLTITDNGDGTYKVDISITKLCNLENGAGTFENHKMTFVIEDPDGEDMTGVIYRGGDGSLTVEITDSTWSLIQNNEVFEGFEQ